MVALNITSDNSQITKIRAIERPYQHWRIKRLGNQGVVWFINGRHDFMYCMCTRAGLLVTSGVFILKNCRNIPEHCTSLHVQV